MQAASALDSNFAFCVLRSRDEPLLMPRFPDAHALLEQALRHVLSEQQTLLAHENADGLTKPVLKLSRLASETANLLSQGIGKPADVAPLIASAHEIETAIDDLSEELWSPLPIAVSAIYERVEEALKPPSGKWGFVAAARGHFHNLRIRLLEQMLGARMLVSNADLGDEVERVWQQFIDRHLGSEFRVLRGGHICDHAGNTSSQIDLIITPADAQFFVPGDSEGGKAQVLVDQVISAIMVTSNLTAAKLKADWRNLQSIPVYADIQRDYPSLIGHPWPFCYILGAQSDSVEKLKECWIGNCNEGLTQFVPQFVVSLDGGFLYSGARRWPAPRFPGNYTEARHVRTVTGNYAGLGLAWLITQHQGRLAVIRGQPLGRITRFARLLDEAMMKPGVPATYSRRFDTMFRMGPIAGIFDWGTVSQFPQNKLELISVRRGDDGKPHPWWEVELMQPVDLTSVKQDNYEHFLRWFRYGVTSTAGDLLALEEWIDPRSKTAHRKRIAVFNVKSGEERTGLAVDRLNNVNEVPQLLS